MKVLRIPRKDHDVYCIDISGKQKKEAQVYIKEQLVLLHPVYGTDTIIDIKRLRHNGHEWAMVTVMQQDVLEEYRILYPRIPFVTATSLAIAEKDFFIREETYICGSERIWFDARTQLIVSEECEMIEDKQEQEETIPYTKWRSIVFIRERKMPLPVSIGIGIVLAALFIVYGVRETVYTPQLHTAPLEIQTAAESGITAIPYITAVRFLEIIADHISPMYAVLEHYRFSDADELLCTFRGTSVETIISGFEAVPYRTGCTMKDLIQKDKETVVTVQTEPDNRSIVWSAAPEPKILAGFMDALKAEVLKNEKLEALHGGHSAQAVQKEHAAMAVRNLQITLSGSDIALASLVRTAVIDAFLYSIETLCNRYQFGITALDVVVAEGGWLSVYAEFRQGSANNPLEKQEHKGQYPEQAIAKAFGYVETLPAKEVPKPTQTVQKSAAAGVSVPLPTIPEGSVEIGKIKTGGKVKTYYRTLDGKIITIESSG